MVQAPRRSVVHGPQVRYPLGGRVDRLVAQWAQRTPDAAALRWQDTTVSYRELVADASRVAGALTVRGVSSQDRVVVRMARGPEQVAVLLGVLLTGAAYAGVSVQWPAARYQQIIQATDARLSVVDSIGSSAGPCEVTAATLLRAGEPTVAVPESGEGTSACSIIFTSGTSGTPHAVVSPHAGTARIALDPVLAFNDETWMLQISPLGWDAPSVELWGPLINGGTCTLFDGVYPTSRDIAHAVAGGVNTLLLVTSLFNAIVDEDIGCLSGLRHVMTGGERISGEHIDKFLASHPEIRLSHVYGPVESTIYATSAELRPTFGPAHPATHPIGHPMANTGIYVLDADHAPVPVGTPGEIAISGDGLALEYLGDPDATADRFVELAARDGGQRAYLTGDEGVLDGDGSLVFLGRRDRQFKLRGMRIDPAEVEIVMEQLPGLRRAYVIGLPIDQISKRETVGFFLGTTGREEVRAYLTARLPAGFVPSRLLRLESMPIAANGKIDQVRLAELVAADSASTRGAPPAEALVPQGEPLAEAITTAAADLLGRQVTADSDLFDLGADSMTVIRLVSRLRQRTAGGLSAGTVLRHRTPRRIARNTPAAATERRTQPGGRSPLRIHGLPATQYRMWYLDHAAPGAGDVVHPLLFRITGKLDIPALRSALNAVVARHEALRTLLRPADPKHIVAEPIAPDELPMLLDIAGEESLESFFARRFDLERDIPLRATLIGEGPGRYLLAFSVHHVAYDGWSEELFCRDLSAAYQVGLSGVAPLGFQAAARLQQQHLDSTRTDDEFWLEHLRAVPELPLGTAAVAASGPLREVPVRLDLVDQQRLYAACAATGTTAAAFYLTAWIIALRVTTGATDFAVGMPVAGRVIEEVIDVIGCFTSSAVLRFPASVPSGPEMVGYTATLLERALTDQFVPLERLLWELRPASTGRTPFCQTGFVLQNNDPARLTLPGATTERIRVPQRSSMFELALVLWPPAPSDSHVWYRADLISDDRAQYLSGEWLRQTSLLCATLAESGNVHRKIDRN